MESVSISELVSDFARLPSMMVVGEDGQTSSTSSETRRNNSHASHSHVQPTPPVPVPQSQDGPHIRFRGSTPQNSQEQEEERHKEHQDRLLPQEPDNPAASARPPPSPRLEPTHRSTLSLNGSVPTSPSRIKVRDLGHIQSFASEELLAGSRHPSRHSLRGRLAGSQQYEISAMPVGDIIEMVAGLLTKITTTVRCRSLCTSIYLCVLQNDRQHENLHRNIPPPEGTAGLSQQASSVLAFHGKNVPSITIASYLSRIHKYCPTTYEVFLSLLVYFDRMTEMVNSGALSSFPGDEDQDNQGQPDRSIAGSQRSSTTAVNSSPTATAVDSPPIATAGSSSPRMPTIVSPEGSDMSSSPGDREMRPSPSMPPTLGDAEAYNLSHYFVVDSFNIHRLVIAGVTCASKFFSDVFYTNSRYAKVNTSAAEVQRYANLIQVGGLPLNELNHLELQFLLLNDFRLSVPIEELDAYGTMLVEFYAREVLSQQQGHQPSEGLYMQTPTPP